MFTKTKTKSSAENVQNSTLSNDFIIHTMQDDLSSINISASGGLVKETSPKTTAPLNQNKPSQPLAPSPFSTTPAPQIQTEQPFKPKSNPVIQTITQSPQPPQAKKPIISSGNNLYKIIFILIISVLIIVLGVGYYYYSRIVNAPVIQTEAPSDIPAETKPPEQNIPVEDTVLIDPVTEKYSATKPNYLPVDFSKTSSTDFKLQLIKIATEIKSFSSPGPYEFILVDNNNNPIIFKFFADIVKLNFPINVSNKLSQNFSLFLYNDIGNMRVGLKIQTLTNEKNTLIKELANQEKTLPTDLNFLFLDSSLDTSQGNFTISEYDTNKEIIRYLNVNKEKTLSIDYTITDSNLLIGTSKETLRKVYLKLKPPVDTESVTNQSSLIPTSSN